MKVKGLMLAGLVGLGSVFGLAGRSDAAYRSYPFRLGATVVGNEFGSQVKCRPYPSFSRDDGSYVLVGQRVRVIGWFEGWDSSVESKQFSRIEINGYRCWVNDDYLRFDDVD